MEKEAVKKALQQGHYSLHSKPVNANAEWWSTFDRILDAEGKIISFVRCRRCSALLAYDVKKTGTSSLGNHAKICRASPAHGHQDIVTMLTRSKNSNISAETKRLVTEALAEMCAKDIRPFEVVTGVGFQHFCQTLLDLGRKSKDPIDAGCLLPDPTTISRRIQSMAETKREQLQKRLAEEQPLLYGITLDYWTNKFTSESYLTITIHYEKDLNIESCVLKTMLFEPAKTAENIRKAIEETLKSYGIAVTTSHIIFVTDNGSNIVAALDGEAHIRCVCHCLNLTVQQAIESVSSLKVVLDECSALVTHFKRTGLQSSLVTSLKKDVDTRWNSIVEMVDSIVSNKDSIVERLNDRNEDHWIDSISFQLLEELSSVLIPFKFGSEQMSADQQPTLHLVLPFLKNFKNVCAPAKNDSIQIVQLKLALLSKLDEKIWLSELHYIATFLHPKTKSLSSLSSTERNQVLKSVRHMFITLGIEDGVGEEQNRPTSTSDHTTTTRNRNSKKKTKKLRANLNVANILQSFDADECLDESEEPDEVEEYFKMKLSIGDEESIFKWWKDRSMIFPRLSRLAIALLCVPASSAASERVFSETGRVLEAGRQQLSRDSVDALVFLRNCMI